MTNVLAWIALGALIGAAAAFVLGPHRRVGRALNVAVGAVGAVLAGWLLSPRIGLPTLNEGRFVIGALVVAAVGAVALLVIVNVLRRGDPLAAAAPAPANPMESKETDDGTQPPGRY